MIDNEIFSKEFEGICPICNDILERGYEYQTEIMGLEDGIAPIRYIIYKCEKCGTSIKKEVNGFFVHGDVIDFDERTVTIRTNPPPSPFLFTCLRFAETIDKITVKHKLDLSDLKWFKDYFEWAEILVIDNVAIKLSG